MERKTSFTLKQLRSRLAENQSMRSCKGHCAPCAAKDLALEQLPIGVVFNEIGAIFCGGNKEAEEDLLGWLSEPNGNAELAHFFLSYGQRILSPEAAKILKDYETNPANQKAVESVKQKLADFMEKERKFS